MKIYRNLAEVPPEFGPSVATIGNFDGVHLGHQWVIAEAPELACDNVRPASGAGDSA
jgi:FAD synthase